MTTSADQLEQLLELDDLDTNLVLAHAIVIIAQDTALTGSQLTRLAKVGERVLAGAVVFKLLGADGGGYVGLGEALGSPGNRRGNLNAPSEWKLDLPGREVTALSLDVFFSKVSASKAEKAKVHRRLAADDARSLLDVWLEVRPQ